MGRKQMRIAGTDKDQIREVAAAAEAYAEARDARMQLTEREVEAKDTLARVMKKHNLSVYKDEDAAPPLIVTLVPGEDKVKVTRAKDDEPDDEPRPPRGRSAAAASAMED